MLGKLLIGIGLIVIAFGIASMIGERHQWFKLGRLPGDIVIERDGNTIFIPITSMIVVSLLISAGFALLRLIRR
ncbi:MAG: DUF2905 domain-containing protein [Fimbriimonadaceae bacterium]